MRITVKIAAAGSTGVARFPKLARPITSCEGPDGRQREDLLRQALNVDGVQFSSSENIATTAFSAEFLTQLESVTEKLRETDLPRRTERAILHSSRRIDHGVMAFVRLDIAFCGRNLRVRLSYDNPKNVAGAAEQFAERYANICARILTHLKTEFSKSGLTNIELAEGKGCDGIFARAADVNAWFDRRDAEMAKIEERNEKRRRCQYRAVKYCTKPPTMTCDCCNMGRCEEAVLPPDLQDQPMDPSI